MADININNYWVNQNEIPTLADVEDGIEQATVTNIEAADLAPGLTISVISSSAPTNPTNGQLWFDTQTAAGSPEIIPKIWNSASAEWLGCNLDFQTSQPATTTTGWQWYDKTLHIWRMYKAAAYDTHGVAGWHPIQEGTYQLWQNKAGAPVGPNRVVVADDTVERGYTTTTIAKNPRVIGVTLGAATSSDLTTASDGYSVLAVVGGGAMVDILVGGSSLNVAVGDAIGTSTVAGTARTLGSVVANANGTANVQITGIPYGAFAIARAAQTSDDVVACKMLPSIGQGQTYRKAATTIAAFANGLADANWDGGWDEVNVSDYPPGSGGSDFIASAKHKPILGVILAVDAAMGSTEGAGVTQTMTLALGPDGSTTMQYLNMEEADNISSSDPGGQHSIQASDLYVPTSLHGATTVLGQSFFWSGTKSASAGTAAIAAGNFRAIGYIH